MLLKYLIRDKAFSLAKNTRYSVSFVIRNKVLNRELWDIQPKRNEHLNQNKNTNEKLS